MAPKPYELWSWLIRIAMPERLDLTVELLTDAKIDGSEAVLAFAKELRDLAPVTDRATLKASVATLKSALAAFADLATRATLAAFADLATRATLAAFADLATLAAFADLAALAALADRADRADRRMEALYRKHINDAVRLGYITVPIVEHIDAQILSAIENGGTLEMNNWHICGTTHCRGGWAIDRAGKPGYDLEERLGTTAAAVMIYAVSRPDQPIPNFYASNEQAMADLRKSAAVSGT